MEVHEIKAKYNCCISLGSSCEPAGHLRRKGLRTFSSPLDWVVSLSLSDVNRLLSNRFSGYMELSNMEVIEGSDIFVDNEVVRQVKTYFVKDLLYNVISVHDFPVLGGVEWSAGYPEYKNKVKFRCQRLLKQLHASRKTLFIRWGSTYEEALQLQQVLKSLAGGSFNILIVNGVDGAAAAEDSGWKLPGICSLTIPNQAGDIRTWDYILKGVRLKSYNPFK